MKRHCKMNEPLYTAYYLKEEPQRGMDPAGQETGREGAR